METEKKFAVTEYNELKATITGLVEKYKTLPDMKEEKAFDKIVVIGRLFKTARIDVEKKRTELNKPLFDKQKMINQAAKDITEMIKPTEDMYITARKEEEAKEKAIKEEKKLVKEKRAKEIQDNIDKIISTPLITYNNNSSSIFISTCKLRDMEITEHEFGDKMDLAKEEKKKAVDKMVDRCQEVKTFEEAREKEEQQRKEADEKLKKEREEFEKQKTEQAEKDRVQKEKQDKIDTENKRIKEKQESAQKKIDDAKAEIESEKKKVEDDKIKAAEKTELIRQKEFDRKKAEEQKKRDEIDRVKKQKEKEEFKIKLEKEAKEEAEQRRHELKKSICMILTADREASVEELIHAIEEKVIPYLRIDWTQK